MKKLTKTDCTAIKKCTDMFFRLTPDGKTTVECWNKIGIWEREENPFLRDICHSFEVDMRISDYGDGCHIGRKYEGFCSQGNRGDVGGGEIDLIAYMVKPDWSIKAYWMCNNTSENMKKENKVNTFMRVEIYNKQGKRVGAFIYEEAVSGYDMNRICYPIN